MTLTSKSNWRIAIASSGINHVKRGIETWAKELALSLSEYGLDVTLFKGSGENVLKNQYKELRMPCLHRGARLNELLQKKLPDAFWRFGLKSDYDIEQLTFAYRFYFSGYTRKFDIIHTQDPLFAKILDRLYQLKLSRAKVILAHGTEESFEYLSEFTHLQHLAPFHFEETKPYKKSRSKWYVAPNFIDTEKFSPVNKNEKQALIKRFDISEDAIVFLSVAAVKKAHKRISYLISEFAKFQANNTTLKAVLVIAGASHPDTNELVTMGKKLCGDKILFLLDQPHGSMSDLYKIADVFVMCSLKEMMPIALLEATSSGLPALVNQHPVVEWMIGEGGQSINMENENELAKTMQVFSNQQVIQEFSRKARQHAVSHFSKNAVISNILQIYQDVLV